MNRPTKGYIYGQLALFGESEIIGFGTDEFKIEEISRKKANEIIINNHYSKKFYTASTIHIGVFVDKNRIGVLQYGFAMNPASMGSVVTGTKIDEYLELNRMWFCDDSPPNAKTMAISYSIKYIKRKYPKIKWIQSFADERCKKFGIVYQAANFVYCGEHTSSFWELDGETFHNSIMTSEIAGPRGYKLLNNPKNKSRVVKHVFRQFRYIYFIKKSELGNLKFKVLPYLKHYKEANP